jgi:hypothetical protein
VTVEIASPSRRRERAIELANDADPEVDQRRWARRYELEQLERITEEVERCAMKPASE